MVTDYSAAVKHRPALQLALGWVISRVLRDEAMSYIQQNMVHKPTP